MHPNMSAQTKTNIIIIVNGQQKTVPDQLLSYEEVVLLAFNPPPTGPNVIITVTYHMPVAQEPQGILTKGGTVQPKNRMIFDVTPTDKS